MQSDKERIEQIMQVKKLNNIEFCNKTSMAPATLSHILSERTKPTLIVLRNIVDAFPDINPMWVMLGEGSMYGSANGDGSATDNVATTHTNGFIDDFFTTNDSTTDGTHQHNGKAHTNPISYTQQSNAMQQPASVKPTQQNIANSQPLHTMQPQQLTHTASLSETDIEKVVTSTMTRLQKPQRRITEVRIFFDDGTYECFTTANSKTGA